MIRRGFGDRVRTYLAANPGLTAQYAPARGMSQIPVTLADGNTVTLTAGGQNVLIKAMVEDLCPRWTPGGRILYIGDAGKADCLRRGQLRRTRRTRRQARQPDLVVYLEDRNWLVLMEAASSHGPVDGKRYGRLARLFARLHCRSRLCVVLPDAQRDAHVPRRHRLGDRRLCADHADHPIHFNGERFLGPNE